MKQQIFYCKSWFRAKKKPTEVWSVEQAEAAHENRTQYTALVGNLEHPYCFIEVADSAVVVGFLDQFLRESLTYVFKEVESGRLFLSMATHREFEAETDKVSGGANYVFKTDGVVHIRHESFNPHTVETAMSSFDPAPNYASRPAFGEYDDVMRIERA
ncbi:hypothetical protein [Pseudoduganella chitinolytica]|uniref:Lytic transglycosylase n=1 Tax=Pseudoduganella chitinolytica TaxID=34070 RepID=A0ABY8BH45_9BURK|nr:hypothetical protein [Pseudoduganella chitinolytica]WEF34266.1 hypothetical protein PX653_05705 [Pseudoduganella chitinolytica]